MMKKVITVFAIGLISLASCTENQDADNLENQVNQEELNQKEIIEIEESTSIVEDGLIELETETESINSEIDSLLNEI